MGLKSMGLILKIAAGIIIGLLVVQIFIFKKTDTDYTEAKNTLYIAQDLKNKHIMLTNAMHSYYKENKKLPTFISELECIDLFRTRQKTPCASVVKDGVFYVNLGNDWASAEPYIQDKKLFNKCRTTRSFAAIDPSFRGCLPLDIASIPDRMTPEIDCGTTSDKAELIICSSDKLTDTDVKLSSVYKKLLANSSEAKKQEIKDDQMHFNQQRSAKCQTSECIKTMTETKITRLELMGVRSPK